MVTDERISLLMLSKSELVTLQSLALTGNFRSHFQTLLDQHLRGHFSRIRNRQTEPIFTSEDLYNKIYMYLYNKVKLEPEKVSFWLSSKKIMQLIKSHGYAGYKYPVPIESKTIDPSIPDVKDPLLPSILQEIFILFEEKLKFRPDEIKP